MSLINVFVEKCDPEVKLPQYAHDGDSGMDVYSTIDVEIHPEETVIIPIGIKVAIPDGYEIQVRPRSGISSKTPLRIANAPGTVDSNFRNEIGVIITNTSIFESTPQNINNNTAPCSYIIQDIINNQIEIFDLETKGNKHGTYKIKKGDRIAQLVLQEVPKINWVEIDDVTKIGQNRQGGFGSTGTK